MPDTSPNDLVTAAAKELGIISEGETLSAAAAQDGLDTLNRIVDQLKAERLAIYSITRTTWTIVSGTQNYTLGTLNLGTASGVRPVYLERVGYIETADDPDTERTLVQLTEDGWRGITQKSLTSTLPTHWYYNPIYPAGVLSLWPVPTSSTLQGVLYAPTAISEFTDRVLSVPPGYRELLVTSLVVRMARSFGRPVTPDMLMARTAAEMVVRRVNFRPADLSFDPAVVGGNGAGYSIVMDQ